MTDPNQPMGPPPSYDEVQNMGGGAGTAPPYPTQPYGYPNQPAAPGMPPGMPPAPYPAQDGFKYDQYSGVPQYPMQQNYGQVPYPMQPGAQYPYGGAPPAGGYPPLTGDQAYYNAQGGVTVQPMLSNTQFQRRRKLVVILFGFVTIIVFSYILIRFLT